MKVKITHGYMFIDGKERAITKLKIYTGKWWQFWKYRREIQTKEYTLSGDGL